MPVGRSRCTRGRGPDAPVDAVQGEGAASIERAPGGEFHLRAASRIERSLDEVFAFFAQPENLELITPPQLGFEILTPLPIEMAEGALIRYRVRVHGVPLPWLTRIDVWEPGVRFVDRQVRGPYRVWVHEHRFEAHGPHATVVHDHVRYRPPLGRLANALVVRRDLLRIFAHRQAVIPTLIGRQDQPAR